MWDMWGDHNGFSCWMMFGGVGMLLFWGALFAFAYLLIRSLSGRERGNGETVPAPETPEETARRRLAAGEITEDEYDRTMSKLHA